MEKHNELQALFDAARNEKPVHTFDDTKDHFLRSVKGTVPTNEITKISLIKKLISMLVPVSIVGVVFSVFYFQEINTADNSPQETSTVQTAQVEFVDTLKSFSTESENIQQPKNSIATAPMPNSIQVPPVVVEQDSVAPQLQLNSVEREVETEKEAALPEKNPVQLDAAYQFPRLTPKEIEANHKQKNEMLKALEKMDKKVYAYIPSGTTKISEQQLSVQAFYMQRTEVTNLEYRTFLFDLLIQGRKEEFLTAKPTQSKWTEIVGVGSKEMEETYFSNDAFNNYPVVNVSREGAEMYCNWLTNELEKRNGDAKSMPLAKVRIPARAEWIYASSAGGEHYPYAWAGDAIRNNKACYLANHKPTDSTYVDDGAFYTAAVNSYLPNNFGLFNMSGNVTEMVWNDHQTKTPGTAGGGWMDDAEQLKIHAPDAYTEITDAHPNIGFRIVISHLN